MSQPQLNSNQKQHNLSELQLGLTQLSVCPPIYAMMRHQTRILFVLHEVANIWPIIFESNFGISRARSAEAKMIVHRLAIFCHTHMYIG